MKAVFPKAKILISFRKHSELIRSIYSQYLHEGGTKDFNDFYDISQNLGFIKKEDLKFKNIINELKKEFENNVFIFTLEEIDSDLKNLLLDLQKFIGGEPPDLSSIEINRHNVSVKSLQSKMLKLINRYQKSYLNPQGKYRLTNRYTRLLGLFPRSICQKKLSFLPSKKMTLPKDIEKGINSYYSDDWFFVQEEIHKRRLMFS